MSKLVARTGLDSRRLATRAQKKDSSNTAPAATITPTIPFAQGKDTAKSSDSKAVALPKTASSTSLNSDSDDYEASPTPQFPGAVSLASADVENARMPQFPGAISLVSMDNEAAPIMQYPGVVSMASVDCGIETMPQFPGAISLISSDVEDNEKTRLPGTISLSNNNETSESRLGVDNLGSSISLNTHFGNNATTLNDASAATAKTNENTGKESSTEFQHSHASTMDPSLQVNKLSSPEMNAVIDLTANSVKCSSSSKSNPSKNASVQRNHY